MDGDDSDEEWSLDTSDEAVLARSQEMNRINERTEAAPRPIPAASLPFQRIIELQRLPLTELKRHCADAGIATRQFLDREDFVDALLPFCEAGQCVTQTRFRDNMQAVTTSAGLIFLDVDGVLNNETTHCHGAVKLDRGNLACLAELINSTAARVVLSTSWRSLLGRKSELWSALEDVGVLEGTIVGQTEEIGWKDRAQEIWQWVEQAKAWPGWNGAFVVLDDMSRLHDDERLRDHFVWVDPEFGLCAEHVETATGCLAHEDNDTDAHYNC